MQKILNTIIIFMMIIQPVSAPGILRAIAAEEPVIEVTAPPAIEVPEEEPSEEVSAPAETVEVVVETEKVETPIVETEVVVQKAESVTEAPIVEETPAVVEDVTASIEENSTNTVSEEQPASVVETEVIDDTATSEVAPVSPVVVSEAPKEIWAKDGDKAVTKENVELGKTYVAPQNKDVTVTFTKLPETSGKLSIEEITLTNEQVATLGALSNKAYDITSTMENGTFEYDLTMPKVVNKASGISYIEKSADEVDSIKKEEIKSIEENVTTTKDNIKAEDVDHFTIFVVVEWNFPDTPGDAVADGGVAMNATATVTVQGGSTITGYGAVGATTYSARANDWNSGSGIKFWRIMFDSTGFKNLKISSKQRSSATGPRDFKMQYKIGAGGTWTDFGPSSITVADNFSGGAVSDISLPSDADNQPDVRVRWIMTSNTAVNGSPVAAGGASNVDDIIVTGDDDMTPPTLNLPADITAEATSSSGATVSFSATADDLAPAHPIVTCISPSGSIFSFGTTVVNCSATDATGNVANGSFNITIQDTTAPTVPVNGVPNATHIPMNNFDFDWDDSFDASTVTYEYQATMDPTEVGGVLTNGLWNSGILPASTIHSAGAPDGTWYWQVRAIDSLGQTSAWSSIWDVTLDTQAPVITLDGANPQIIEGGTGSVYTELGATVSDNIDSGLTATIDASAVNTMAVGSYLVTYNVSDQAGNAATQVTRTVNVVDTTAPVISGVTNQTVEMDSVSGAIVTYGITAVDAMDGPLPVNCVPVSGSVFSYGTSSAICSATDADGNNATASFNVTVVDTTGPIDVSIAYSPIDFSNTSSVDVTYSIGSDFSALNLATGRIQKRTGDVSGSACVNWGTWTNLVYETDGSYTDSSIADGKCYRYRYAIKDNVGNQSISVVAGTVKIDQSAPVISGFGDIVIEATNPAGDVANFNPTAVDNVDGSVSVVCVPVAGSVFAIGTTTVSCEAEDSLGNKSIETFVVTVQDTTAPTIDNVSDIIEEATSPAGAAATFVEPMSHDAVDGDLIATCDAVSGATFALGVTIVTCTKTDSAGNVATPETFTITVQDTTAPVIALNGDNPQTVERKEAYVEAGANVTDNYDTALVVTIDASAVDVNVAGTYSVYYDVTDTAGNPAVQVVRTVNVTDTIDPVVTFDDETNPADGLLTSNANQTFAITVDEDVATCQLNFGASTVTTATSQITWNHSFPEDTNGSWHFYSPAGTDYAFPDRYANAGPGGNSWVAPVVYDMSSAFAGEQMGGTWQLLMNDHVGWDSGAITNVDLILNGQNYSWNGWAGIWDYSTTTVDIPVAGGSGGPSSGVYDMTVVHDGDSATASVNLPAISDGVYEYTVTCSDLSDNEGTSEIRDITIDTTAPSLSAKTTFEGWYNTDQTSVFNYMDINGIASGDNPECIISTEGVGQTCSVVPNVCDVVGNCNTDEVVSNGADIDKSNPEVSAGMDKQTNAEFMQDATASDSISGIATYAWTQESGPGSVTFGAFDAEDSTVSADVDGTYVIRLTVTDNAGNSSFDEFTLIWDTTKPVITRTGNDPIIIEYAGTYTEQGATWTDVIDGAGNATVGGDTVDTSALGTYIVTYDYTDVAGNSAEQVTRTVKIVDTTAPVVTLNGGDVSFRRGHTYHEQGATWTDNVDGSGNVVTITGTVNENRRGTYYLTYSYIDSSGNESSIVRKIVVKKQSANDNGGGDGGNNADDTQGIAGPSIGGGAGADEETTTGENAGEESIENAGTENGGQPEVKGAESGQVLGEEISAEEDGFWNFSWWWLLIFVLAGLGLYRITRRKI